MLRDANDGRQRSPVQQRERERPLPLPGGRARDRQRGRARSAREQRQTRPHSRRERGTSWGLLRGRERRRRVRRSSLRGSSHLHRSREAEEPIDPVGSFNRSYREENSRVLAAVPTRGRCWTTADGRRVRTQSCAGDPVGQARRLSIRDASGAAGGRRQPATGGTKRRWEPCSAQDSSKARCSNTTAACPKTSWRP